MDITGKLGNMHNPADQRALRAVAVQFFVNGAVMASYVPRLPEVRDALGTDLAMIGQIITWASLAGLLGSWLSDWVLRNMGTRSAMIYGTVGLIILLPLVALAPSVWALVLVLGALMLVDVIVDVAMNKQGSDLSARRHAPVMNRLHGLWSIGTVVGGLMAAGMAAMAVPLFWHLLAAAVLMAGALWYIGGGLLTTDRVVQFGDGPASSGDAPRRVPISLWVFGLLGAMAFIPEMVGGSWAAFRLHDDLHSGVGAAGMGFVVFSAGMVVGRLSGDWVAAKMDKGRLLKYATLTSFVGFALACLVDAVPLAFVGFAIAGLGISVLFPSLYDAAAQDPRPGAALGTMTAGSRIAMLAAPAVIGYLADLEAASVGVAMMVMAAPCLLAIGWLSVRAFGR